MRTRRARHTRRQPANRGFHTKRGPAPAGRGWTGRARPGVRWRREGTEPRFGVAASSGSCRRAVDFFMWLVPRAMSNFDHHTSANLHVHKEHRQTVSFARSQELVDFCSEVPLDCIQFAIVRRNRMTKVIGHGGIARTNLGLGATVRFTSQTCARLLTGDYLRVATSAATTHRCGRCRG